MNRLRSRSVMVALIGVWALAAASVQAQDNGAMSGQATGSPAASATAPAAGSNSPTAAPSTSTTTPSSPAETQPLGAVEASASGSSSAMPAGIPGSPVHGASGAGTKHFDLAGTVSAALAASVDLANAERTAEIDRKRSDEASAQGRPNIGAQGSATRFDAATKIAFGAGPPVTLIGDHTETLALNLSEKLDLTGQIHAASSQAKLQSLADEIRNQRILRAQSTYYNVLRAEHQVAVAQESLSTAQVQQKNAVNLNQQQVGQKIDVLRANTQVATAQQDVLRAENNLHIAAESFDDLVGLPIDTPVAVDDVAGVTVGAPIANTSQVGAPETNMPLFSVPPSAVSGFDLATGIQTADANRPEVLGAQVVVREAQTGIKIAHAGLEPVLSLNATGDYYPTTSFQNPRKRTAALTATLSVPLWDGGATRDRVAEARLQRDDAEASLQARKNDVALDVGQAYLNLTTAANQIDAANSELQQAIAARQLAEIRYEGQVGLYLEVTDAQAALVAAENNQVNAVYDYLVARAQYQNALGLPDVK
jgi:outer membrane protein